MVANKATIETTRDDDLQAESLRVTGMTCAACSARVEKVVGRLEGVSDVHVNLATERMDLHYDPARVGSERIRETVQAAGYGVEEAEQIREILLPVEGMTCAACAARIEKVVGRLDGVRSAAVNLLEENAVISYVPEITPLSTIRHAIEQAGYTPGEAA